MKAETERLILRELVLTDAPDIFEMDSDPKVHLYLGNKPITTLQQAEDGIRYINKQYSENGIGRWAVVEKTTGECIGWCGLKFFSDMKRMALPIYTKSAIALRKNIGAKVMQLKPPKPALIMDLTI